MSTDKDLEDRVRGIAQELEEIREGNHWCLAENDDRTVYSAEEVIEELIDNDQEDFIETILPLFKKSRKIAKRLQGGDATKKDILDILTQTDSLELVLNELEEKDKIAKAGMKDYFDDALDHDIAIDRYGEFKDIRFTVGCGGPNIYVDTCEGAVLGYWGRDTARTNLSTDTVRKISDFGEELYDLVKRN
jgi:hypothetical protein